MTHYAISGETLPGAAFDAGWMTSAPHHRFATLCPPPPLQTGLFSALTPSLAGAYLPV
jgi:hypothetical protein